MAIGTFRLPICDVCGEPWLPRAGPERDNPETCKRCGKCKTTGWNRKAVGGRRKGPMGLAIAPRATVVDGIATFRRVGESPPVVQVRDAAGKDDETSDAEISNVVQCDISPTIKRYLASYDEIGEAAPSTPAPTEPSERQFRKITWAELQTTLAGLPDAEIARRMGCSRQAVTYARRRMVGNCERCDSPAESHSAYCARHRDMARRNQRKKGRFAPWKPGGRGRPPADGKKNP